MQTNAVAEEPAAYRTLRHDTLPVMRILNDMVNARLINKDTLLSAYVKVRCKNASKSVFDNICALEKGMLAVMREEEPDAEGWLIISLRRINQRLVDESFSSSPEIIRTLLKSLAQDGQGLAGNRGSIELKYLNKDHYRLKLQRSWDDLTKTMEKRHAVAGIILNVLINKIPSTTSGEHLVKFSETELLDALKNDMFIAAQIKDFNAAIDRGLLYLHEQKSIILQQGLAVFRQAMTVQITAPNTRRFTIGDFSSLKEHYLERNFQIHVMNKYADLGLEKITTALAMVTAYFTLGKSEFVKRYFAGEQDMLDRATSAESYQTIVDHLNNPIQVAVVAAKITDNMLVLAGPGSGKTRVIAHRCAYLLQVERVRPHEILVVCFNRSAAISLRQRIRDLVGKSASRVTVQTYHALAMRLIGASFSGRMEGKGEMLDLDSMIPEATKMLRGECDIPGLERDEMRERLLAGYRHILIDEYQDIDKPQYDMVSAIAGRALESENEDSKLSILAVGDDDQNIYTFRGANIQFIRQFEQDYAARAHYLIENYRSTENIINVSNQLIALNRDRMKTERPIQIDAARRSEPAGDPVQIMGCNDPLHQARYILDSIQKLRQSDGSIAVFSRTKKEFHAIRAALEHVGIPSVMAANGNGNFPLHRLRESHALIELVKQLKQVTITASSLHEKYHGLGCYEVENPWCQLVDDILAEWEDETNNSDRTPAEVIDFIYDALHERQRERVSEGSVYLSTVHSAKGLEFDHVIILGNWDTSGVVTDLEEERRIYYVGMTRARKTLTLCELEKVSNPHTHELKGKGVVRSKAGLFTDPPDEALRLQYAMVDLSGVWIGYPTFSKGTRRKIAKLHPGSLVHLEQREDENRIFIRDAGMQKVGALSSAASKVWKGDLQSIKEVRVCSIVNWRKDLLEQEPAKNCPDDWEIPLLEIVTFDRSQNG